REGLEHWAGPAQVLDGSADAATFDEEEPVARHAGLQRAARIAKTIDVVKPGDEETPVDLGEELRKSVGPGGHLEMSGRRIGAVVIGKSGVTGRTNASPRRGAKIVARAPCAAGLHEDNLGLGDALAVE